MKIDKFKYTILLAVFMLSLFGYLLMEFKGAVYKQHGADLACSTASYVSCKTPSISSFMFQSVKIDPVKSAILLIPLFLWPVLVLFLIWSMVKTRNGLIVLFGLAAIFDIFASNDGVVIATHALLCLAATLVLFGAALRSGVNSFIKEKQVSIITQSKASRFITKWWVVILIIIIVSIGYWRLHTSPFPTDEEMITYFNDHRSEFESLVKSYRLYKYDSHNSWESLPENTQTISALKIERVFKNGPWWFSDPYTVEGAKRFKELALGYSYKKNPEGYNIQTDNTNRAIEVGQQGYRKASLRFPTSISKNYIYYPMVPKIENEKLLYPLDMEGRPGGGLVVLNSLNQLPKTWGNGQCFLRKIDSQWFLKLCRSY